MLIYGKYPRRDAYDIYLTFQIIRRSPRLPSFGLHRHAGSRRQRGGRQQWGRAWAHFLSYHTPQAHSAQRASANGERRGDGVQPYQGQGPLSSVTGLLIR